MHAIDPIPFTGSPAEARERLFAVVRGMRGATVREAGERHVKVEFRTRFLRFVDDADFLLVSEEGRIHFRSASRLGRSDFGVNRRRMEEVRRRFAVAEAGSGVNLT